MFKTKFTLLALAVALVSAQTSFAQHYHPQTHFDNVPLTTTHTDTFQHGNHLHSVPHTTTHVDQVPHTTYQPHFQGQNYSQPQATNYPSQQQYDPQRQQYFPQRQRYRQYQQQHVVPHTTTHNHYQQHNGHIDVVPHTTTHFDVHGH